MTPKRRTDERTTRSRAWATSVGLHTLGIAGALTVSTFSAADAEWSAARASTRSTLAWTATWTDVRLPPEPETEPPTPEVEDEAPTPVPIDELPAEPQVLVDPTPVAEPFQPAPATAVAVRQPPRPDWAAPVPRVPPPVDLALEPTPVPTESDVGPADSAFVAPSPLPGHNEPPDYPFVAFRRGTEGSVVVILEVDVTGAVSAAHVAVSSGSGALDDAALQKLSTWRFQPAQRLGRPVPSTFRKEVVFRITN